MIDTILLHGRTEGGIIVEGDAGRDGITIVAVVGTLLDNTFRLFGGRFGGAGEVVGVDARIWSKIIAEYMILSQGNRKRL